MVDEIKLHKTNSGKVFLSKEDACLQEAMDNFMLDYKCIQGAYRWRGPTVFPTKETMETFADGSFKTILDEYLAAYDASMNGIPLKKIDKIPDPPAKVFKIYKLDFFDRIALAIIIIFSGKIPDKFIK